MQLARISARLSWTFWTGMSSTTGKTGMQLYHNLQKTETKLPGSWTGHSSQSFVAQWLFNFVFLHLGVNCLRCWDGTRGWWSHLFYFCTVNWAGIRSVWQKPPSLRPEGQFDLTWEWILHEMKASGTRIFSSKTYSRIQILNRLVSATK